MGRSDPMWGEGKEYESPEDVSDDDWKARLAREELKTRILINNCQMLIDVCEEFRKGWTKQ